MNWIWFKASQSELDDPGLSSTAVKQEATNGMVADPWGLYVYVYVVISMLWHQSCWNSKLVHFGLRTFKYEHHDYVESRI